MSDSPPLDSIEETRRRLYQVARMDPEWAIAEILPVLVGSMRSLASINHKDLAQVRAGEAIEAVDALVARKMQELDQ